MLSYLLIVIFTVYKLPANAAAERKCSRIPENPNIQIHSGDNGFRIKLSGNPEKYTPQQVYTVTIGGTFSHQFFTGFELVSVRSGAVDESDTAGYFQQMDPTMTKFSENCYYIVTNVDDEIKKEIQVLWTAPPKGYGCVQFRSSILDRENVSFKDEGALTLQICENDDETESGLPMELMETCCACGSAKYRLNFTSVWDRTNHPQAMPPHIKNSVQWSAIVGVSHSRRLSIWQYAGEATPEVNQVCRYGQSDLLEQMLRQQSDHVRTVIKTSALFWSNGELHNRSAHFTVDNQNHLLSFLSKMVPSPDWCVGVSALNLCEKSCRWKEEVSMELYPWDAGSMDGQQFQDSNWTSEPQESIHRLFDPTQRRPTDHLRGVGRPFALLNINKITQSSTTECHTTNQNTNYEASKDLQTGCVFGGWSEWSSCSATCGSSHRRRRRLFSEESSSLEEDCEANHLVEDEACPTDPCFDENADCDLSSWSSWSSCRCVSHPRPHFDEPTPLNVPSQARHRLIETLVPSQPRHRLIQTLVPPQLRPRLIRPFDKTNNDEQTTTQNNPSTFPATRYLPAQIRMPFAGDLSQLVAPQISTPLVESSWGARPWRSRSRTLAEGSSCEAVLVQQQPCLRRGICHLTVKMTNTRCYQPPTRGPCRTFSQQWYYDNLFGRCMPFKYGGCHGNQNRFDTKDECVVNCVSDVLENNSICIAGSWSSWSQCSKTCGSGATIERSRTTRKYSRRGRHELCDVETQTKDCSLPVC